jgi:hypothetical protein
METSLGGGTEDISRDLQVMQTYDRIQAAFPSEGSMEMVVEGEQVNATALRTMFEQIIANNRAGGWRRLKRES